MAYNELYSNNGIDTDDANATASQILSGYTAYVKGKKITGTIPSQGAQTITPGTTNKTIASGKYLSGTQTIKGDSNLVAGNIKKGASIFGITGTYTSDANATAANILSGKTAYVNGSKITGSMLDRTTVGKNGGIGINSSYRAIPVFVGPNPQTGKALDGNTYAAIGVPSGFYNGGGYVGVNVNTVNLKAENIKSGITIFGVSGNYKGAVTNTTVIMSHQNYDYDDAAQFTINGNMCSHVSTNKGVVTFKFNVTGRVYVRSTFFHWAETGSVGKCSIDGWNNVRAGQTFTISTIIGGTAAHGNNKRVIAAVSISM